MRIASVMVVLTIWLGACGEAVAEAGSVPPAGTKQGWERQHLGDHVSEPGEALPDFLRRTGRVLHDYTRQSGNEACGAIASDGQRFFPAPLHRWCATRLCHTDQRGDGKFCFHRRNHPQPSLAEVADDDTGRQGVEPFLQGRQCRGPDPAQRRSSRV